MKNKQTIIIAGGFKLPENNAGATRALNIGRTLTAAGYHVVLLGMGTKTKQSDIDDMDYQVLLNSNQCLPRKAANFVRFPYKIIKSIKEIGAKQSIKAIIIEGPSGWLTMPLIGFAKKNNIKIVIDAVEWYNITHFKGGIFNIQTINHLIGFYFSYAKSGNIIAISRLLEKRFLAKNCNTFYMPVTYDTAQYLPGSPPKKPSYTIAYAGIPGKKDLIANAVKGLLVTEEARGNIRFQLMGVSKNYLKKALHKQGVDFEKAEKCIELLGRVPVDKAREAISKADFTVLLRPNERFATAGFPTKFVESITLGTPVILNLTSDLSDFVQDGINTVILKDSSAEAFSNGLKQILLKTEEERSTLSHNARQLAVERFDYHNFTNSLAEFIEQ